MFNFKKYPSLKYLQRNNPITISEAFTQKYNTHVAHLKGHSLLNTV